MFPSFIGILDIQSWWEVPSIAYFCSLFRTAFNLLDFDIEELEEALLTDGSEECASTLLTELIVRLLNGCLANNEVSAFNYQMFLRRLFREKCKSGRYNPFNTDIDFQFLPLRTKVEILYALCDFRLDAEDVFELFKNLDAESLRVEPLGWDDNSSAYWYFYGTRLYREDYKQKSKNKKKRSKEEKRKKRLYGDDSLEDPDTERVWQVVCFTEADWTHLTEKFKNAASRVEKELYQSLSENFLPEIPRLFQEKERLQRKRLLEFAPRRTSVRVLQKIKQKEEEDKSSVETRDSEESKVDEENVKKDKFVLGRESRAKRREQLRSKSEPSNSSEEGSSSEEDMPPKERKKILIPIKPESASKTENLEKRETSAKSSRKKLKKSTHQKGDPPSTPLEQPVKTGRKTNNSLACATGQIVIPDTVDQGNSNSTRKILKTSQIFSQSEEDIQTDMYKVLEQLTAHEDAWPFMDPVEEEYAPNYYAVIRRPMDLRKMEERLDSGFYTDFSAFQSDFKLIVNNCRLYNGQDNEYTAMVDNLQEAFDRLTERYIHRASSSDEEIAVEYQMPTPSRKHKLKQPEESSSAKKKKRTHSTSDNLHSSPESNESSPPAVEEEKSEKKDVRTKPRDGKLKKKHKQHHRHSKHSRSHKPSHHKTSKKEAKYLRKLIHHLKKEKHRKRKRRHSQKESEVVMKHSSSNESLESSNRSRSASPLPSIHTPTPTPSLTTTPSPPPSPDQLNNPDFFKDKYDIIKERRRQTAKDNWDTLVDHKQKNTAKPKKNLSIPEKDKNQKLKETIEKLKAKNEKYKETLMYNNLLPSKSSARKRSTSETHTDGASLKDQNKHEFVDSDHGSQKSQPAKSSKEKDSRSKKAPKKPRAGKNESATDQALEQAVKDISKWLDNAPKSVSRSTSSSSPAPTNSTEEQDSRLDDDFSSDKSQALKKDLKKRTLNREQKLPSKRREIQRTIERLQPGKSKGNLIANATTPKLEEIIPLGPHNKSREIKSVLTTKVDELSPKLSLGSVLPTVGFNLGKDHKFPEESEKIVAKPKHTERVVDATSVEVTVQENPKAKPECELSVIENKTEENTKEEEKTSQKFSQEKVTPNLSAWFKAFGAPKSSPTPTNKKKNEEIEQDEKQPDEKQPENKLCSPKNAPKYDSPPDEISPTPDGGDSPSPNITVTPRQRRTSTGSSVSERSSFSQDLDSPRLQISHTSPLVRSPASPRTDEFQKILYPIINGTVRAGFYQDTTSLKSSPEKSCSPREAPQSPYSPYSQHVYASNSASTTANPSYYVDHNKSPVPTYGLNQPPPYYDTSKAPIVNKPPRVHDDYTALCPDGSYQQSPYSPAPSPYSQHSQHSPYSQVNSPISQNSPAPIPDKSSLFPAKKRAYNEELSPSSSNKFTEKLSISDNTTELNRVPQNKGDYKKIVQSMSSLNFGLGSASVDNIALALSKKSEALKMKGVKENSGMNFLDRMGHESTSNFNDDIVNIDDVSKHSQVHTTMAAQKRGDGLKNSPVDMINMGYFASELERRSDISEAELLHSNRDLQKTTMPKGYGGVAMNLGVNKGATTKYYQPSKQGTNMDIIHNETMNQNILEFDNIQSANQSVSNYGLSEFDIASKKFYAGGTVRTDSPIDYGNWKTDNHLRRIEPVHSNYQTHYIDNNDSNKATSNINVSNANATNYSKALHSQQLQALAGNRAPILREAMQQNLSDALRMPSELRIPNPRSMMKSDYMGDVGISDSDIMGRNTEGHTMQKPEKLKQNQTMATSLQYKPSYSEHSSLPLDTLRTIPNLPQMLERYNNNERYLAGYGTSTTSMYHDKNLQMAQIFNKSLPSDVHQTTSSVNYSQATLSKDNMSYKSSGTGGQISHADKMKQRRKKSAELKVSPISGTQSYHPQVATTDVLSSVKTSLVPGSAFNFGPSAGMGLSGTLYSDSSGFSLEDFRNTTAANQFMAANYMAAAAAIQQHHQLKTNEAKVEKHAKPAHQNTSHSSTGTFPFISHAGQVRAGYQFVGTDPSSPLYQQYLQRHQEELLRHSAPIMGLYPPGYHPGSLGARQPYDAMNRPPWI